MPSTTSRLEPRLAREEPSKVTEELEQLRRIQGGDAEAFGAWAADAERPLRLSLRAFCEQVDTEAVLQEALLRVWQVAPRFVPDGQPHALLRFAVRTVRNCAVSEVRRLRPELELEALLAEVDAQAAVAPDLPDPLLRRAIARCRAALPGQPAAALGQRLAASGGEDDLTLATRVNMKLNTFLQNVTRARRLLRLCLERAGVSLEGLAP
jgi:DNA-directed RNA polymerase specialized sigma24 family protein